MFLGIAEIKTSGSAVFHYSISGLSDRLAHFVFYISPSYDGGEQKQSVWPNSRNNIYFTKVF